MVINPFKVNNQLEKTDEETVNISEIIEYISNNYSKYLKIKSREFFEDKIKEYILFKYSKNKNIKQITTEVLNKIFGYGILQKYIEDKNITDIRVVKFNLIYVKKEGLWQKVNERFNDKNEFRDYIKYCALKNNKSINYDEPLVILSDKEYKLRIEAGIYPVNSLNDSLIIRIHRYDVDFNLDDLVDKNMLNINQKKCIIDALNRKKNIVIAGKGGSGKTTLLRGILKEFNENTSISICEETAELFIEGKNIVSREIISNKIDKNIDLNILLKHSLVMSNDVIVVGELKGEETATFVDAISTGHTGITTVHANSSLEVIDRLTILFKRDIKTQRYSTEFVQNILYSGIDYIIFMKDFKLCEISKVCFDSKSNKYFIKKIFSEGKEYVSN